MPVARLFEFSAPALRRAPPALLQMALALASVVTGVLDLPAGQATQPRSATVAVHALFGLLLCSLIYSRSRWYGAEGSGTRHHHARSLDRHLRQVIWLIVCLVVAIREAAAICGRPVHGGALDFSLLDSSMRAGPDHSGWNPYDHIQLFIASVLVALIFARAVAFRTSSYRVEWNPESAE